MIFVILTGFQVQNPNQTPNFGNYKKTEFESRIYKFLNSYIKEYNGSDERFLDEQNEKVLEEKGFAAWEMIMTLESKNTFKNSSNQTVYQKVFFGFFEFKNSVLTQNALNIIMNCLGTDCAMIKWGNSDKSIKSTPMIYIINEKEIISCKIKCEHINANWDRLKMDLIKTFGKSGTRIVTVGCGGKPEFTTL